MIWINAIWIDALPRLRSGRLRQEKAGASLGDKGEGARCRNGDLIIYKTRFGRFRLRFRKKNRNNFCPPSALCHSADWHINKLDTAGGGLRISALVRAAAPR